MRRAGVTSDWLMRHRGVIDIEVLQLDPIASSAGRYDQVVEACEAGLIRMFLPWFPIEEMCSARSWRLWNVVRKAWPVTFALSMHDMRLIIS